MKNILVAKGRANTGKTTAICKLKDFLLNSGGKIVSEYRDVGVVDVNLVIDYKGILIGISSAGDPGLDQKSILTRFYEAGCIIIVCACRTKGSTKEDILQFCKSDDITFFIPTSEGFISCEEMKYKLKSVITTLLEQEVL